MCVLCDCSDLYFCPIMLFGVLGLQELSFLWHLHFRKRISCSFWGKISKVGLESEIQLTLSLYSTYMVTGSLWKWYKTFLLTQRIFFFLSNSGTGIKNQYGKHGNEVFCSTYFFEGPVWMYTHLGNRSIFFRNND